MPTSTDVEEAEPAWVVATVAGTRHVGSRDGRAHGATFASPRCVLPLPDGSLLVVDAANSRLRRIADGGGGPVVTTVAPKALFFNPRCIALLPDGGVLVCNAGHNRLARLCLETNTSSQYAGCGRKGHRDGPAHTAEFSSPSGLCVCGDGTVLVADTANHCIRSIAGPPNRCAWDYADRPPSAPPAQPCSSPPQARRAHRCGRAGHPGPP